VRQGKSLGHNLNDVASRSLRVYSVALVDVEDVNPLNTSFRLLWSTSRPQGQGSFYEARVSGNIVATAIARFAGPTDPPTHQILLVNTLTGAQLIVDPELPEALTQLHLELCSERIIMTGVRNWVRNLNSVIVRVHDLPRAILDPPDKLGEPIPDVGASVLGPPVAEHETLEIANVDFTPPSAPLSHNPTFLPLISSSSYQPVGNVRRSGAYMFYFPLDQDGEIRMRRFHVADRASADFMCLGQTGRRAIWLEHRWEHGWEADEFFLMKGSFSPDVDKEPVVAPLLPRHLALPFELHTCQSLAFEEASGLICLGLHTGELYILEL